MIGQDQRWKKVTVSEAHLYSENGYLVWWRPNGVLNKLDPDNDVAWVLEVK